MANVMKDVARALGVELEEEFNIEGDITKYQLSEYGLEFWSATCKDWRPAVGLEDILIGNLKIIKLPKSILTEKEREYLSAVIKPFKDRKVVIKKHEYPQNEYRNECIQISVQFYDKTGGETVSLPIFKKGTMYKGLEINKCYTLDELGL